VSVCMTILPHKETTFSTPTSLLLHSSNFFNSYMPLFLLSFFSDYQIWNLFSVSSYLCNMSAPLRSFLFFILFYSLFLSIIVFKIPFSLSESSPISNLYSSVCSQNCTLSLNSPVQKSIHIMDAIRKDINMLK
jgi:hypothetical protein